MDTERSQFDSWAEAEALAQRRAVARVAIGVFFAVNALFTAAYGGMAVLKTWPLASQGTLGQRLAVVLAAGLAAATMGLLFDGARLAWHMAANAGSTTAGQQRLAAGLEWASFAGSLAASVVALRLLGAMAGLWAVTDEEGSAQLVALLASSALSMHFVGAMVYSALSMEARALRSAAGLQAQVAAAIMARRRFTAARAMENAVPMLDQYQAELDTALAHQIVADTLRQLGHGQAQALPAHHGAGSSSAASTTAGANGTHMGAGPAAGNFRSR